MKWAAILSGVGLACAGLFLAPVPAQAEQMRLEGYFPAGSDEAATLRSIAVDDFAGEEGPRLAQLVADALRAVRIDGQPWLSVPAGRFGRDAEAVLDGHVRTRFVENPITLRRTVCVQYDDYDSCLAREEREVPCLQVVAYLRPDLRLTTRSGRLVWSFAQEASRTADYCPDHDDQPNFAAQFDDALADFARQVRYALAPAHEWRSVRVMGGRDDLPRTLRDSYRTAMRQVERDAPAACAIFESLQPQAPQHHQLRFNTGLCAEQRGDLATAEDVYRALAQGRGAAREGRDGMARIAQYRRAQAQIASRGG